MCLVLKCVFFFYRSLLPIQDIAVLQTVQHRTGYSKVNYKGNIKGKTQAKLQYT